MGVRNSFLNLILEVSIMVLFSVRCRFQGVDESYWGVRAEKVDDLAPESCIGYSARVDMAEHHKVCLLRIVLRLHHDISSEKNLRSYELVSWLRVLMYLWSIHDYVPSLHWPVMYPCNEISCFKQPTSKSTGSCPRNFGVFPNKFEILQLLTMLVVLWNSAIIQEKIEQLARRSLDSRLGHHHEELLSSFAIPSPKTDIAGQSLSPYHDRSRSPNLLPATFLGYLKHSAKQLIILLVHVRISHRLIPASAPNRSQVTLRVPKTFGQVPKKRIELLKRALHRV
mmetsp:Transcript_29665/g.114226  ORF Transcript_29665/g.114226 Transcript_29665/m.114226 type:complete len:282 (+) Transcript_29665:215-1060(+)